MAQIMLHHDEGGWRQPAIKCFRDESELRNTLAASPELVPGVSATAKTCAEFRTASGPADLVIVDDDGTITLVECKLTSNSQVKRAVVGQILDYAAALWKISVDRFDEAWSMRTGAPLLRDDGSGPKRDVLARNLAEGRFRMVVAGDGIGQPSQRISEYLNASFGRSDAVIAVDYVRIVEGPLQIVIPRVCEQKGSSDRQAPIGTPAGLPGAADGRQPREALERAVRSFLAEGCSDRATARLAGTSKSTVWRIRQEIGDKNGAAQGPQEEIERTISRYSD